MPKGNPHHTIVNGISQNMENNSVSNDKKENQKSKKSTPGITKTQTGDDKVTVTKVFNDLVMNVVTSENAPENEIQEKAAGLNAEQTSMLSEIKLALLEPDYEVSDKFKVKLLEEETLEALISRTKIFQ